MSRKTMKIVGDERAAQKTCGYGLHSIRALTERDVNVPSVVGDSQCI